MIHTLPNDVARCTGGQYDECGRCLRLFAGRADAASYQSPRAVWMLPPAQSPCQYFMPLDDDDAQDD
jgi:hypothetical protein